jgi:hypothetical protein
MVLLRRTACDLGQGVALVNSEGAFELRGYPEVVAMKADCAALTGVFRPKTEIS